MSTLSDLEKALNRAQQARYKAQDERNMFERRLKDEFDARLARELKEGGYLDRVRAATIAENEAREAVEREKARIALEETQHPYPLGTRMVEWEYPSRLYRVTTPADRRLTGRVGVLEIITPESEHPGNKTYGRAIPGELVIRVLKKDGTPSKVYEMFRWSEPKWVPEGTDLLQEDLSWPKPEKEKEDDKAETDNPNTDD